MTFFQNLLSAVTNYAQNAVSGPPPFHVYEIYPKQFIKETSILSDQNFSIYKDKLLFNAVLCINSISQKAYSMWRMPTEEEGAYYFNLMSAKLQKMCELEPDLYTLEKLQLLSDVIRNNTGYGVAHIAAKLKLIKVLSMKEIAPFINEIDPTTGKAPIHVAIESGDVECVKEMIICKANTKLVDKNDWTVFHYAAKYGNDKIIQLLASKDTSMIDKLNVKGESALHEACLADKPSNVELLLRWKCSPNITNSDRYPIHCALQAESEQCIKILSHWSTGQIKVQDKTNGGTPMHWAKNRKCINTLYKLGADLEVLNVNNETPLLQKVREGLFECVLALLIHGANADALDANLNGCLHLAIEHGNPAMIQLLIVFGANVNQINRQGDSVRHKAAISLADNKNQMVCILNGVGAERCSSARKDCASGCQHGGMNNGKITNACTTPIDSYKPFHELMEEISTKEYDQKSTPLISDNSTSSNKIHGDRILCLDGGGIRGLILIQILLEIERIAGVEICKIFDWIGGTSTGGILALGIARGKSMRVCQGMYFQLKDKVFKGKRPYNSEALENFLIQLFGQHTKMSDILTPKVMVTAILADRFPTDLHLFRNYELNPQENELSPNITSHFKSIPKPNEQLIWKAARSSGAAPTYFRASERYLDGGLMSNNPTLDVLTEVNQYNVMLRKKKKVPTATLR